MPGSLIFLNPKIRGQKGLRRALTFLKEKNFVRIFFFVNLIAALRVFSETTFLDYEFENSLTQILRFYLENDYYFLIAVFTVPALVLRFTREAYPALLSLTAKFFPIILLAPWVDHFLAGKTEGYQNAEVTPGILLQVALTLSGVVVYVLLRTKKIFKSAAAGVCAYLMLWFFAMPEFVFSPQLNFASDTFLQFYYFIPFLIGAAVFFKWNDPDSFRAFRENLRPLRALEGTLLALAGALTVYFSGYRVHEVHVLHAAALIFLLKSIPAGGMPLGASVAVSFVTISFGFTLGPVAFFLSILALTAAFAGKVSRLSLKSLRGGTVAALAYFIALYSSSYVHLSMDPAMAAWGVFFFIYGASGQYRNWVLGRCWAARRERKGSRST